MSACWRWREKFSLQLSLQPHPTGKSAKTCLAPFAKIFWFSEHPNHLISAAIPARTEGRIAIVTDVGRGCGGRGSVGRARDRRAGFACERSDSAQTTDAKDAFARTSADGYHARRKSLVRTVADGEVVWS
jgi:hypothetical protein